MFGAMLPDGFLDTQMCSVIGFFNAFLKCYKKGLIFYSKHFFPLNLLQSLGYLSNSFN